jgi:GSH-dependent disulfide-bond oxidoreductase
MIELHSWPTPNGMKVSILLEEAGIAHRVHPVSIRKGEQFEPGFLAISPNNRIPAIVDTAPNGGGASVSVFESGAILLYLAEKVARFIPDDVHGRAEVLQWLFWQMGGLGPMAGQNGHFNIYAPEKVPYAIDRYTNETTRLYGVMDKRLADREFLAGAYSIADMACYPWIVPHEAHKQDLDKHPNLKRWFETIAARPMVMKAYAEKDALYPADNTPMTDEEKQKLFGFKPV